MHAHARWLSGPNRQLTRFGQTPRFREGLYQLSRACFAWMVPNGSWGETNLGLISSGSQSLMIDTAWDIRHTQELLGCARDLLARAPIEAVVNTHADGDHCWGNQLFADKPIVGTQRCIAQFDHVTPSAMRALQRTARWTGWLELGGIAELSRYVKSMCSPYDFTGIRLTQPNQGFSGERVLRVGEREVIVCEVGPAHTDGDAFVFVPDERVVYAGDILFVGITPVAWAGPVENIVRGLRRVAALEVDVIVPGHGPLASKRDVQALIDYWEFVLEAIRARFQAGMPPVEAAHSVLASSAFQSRAFARWELSERLVTSAVTMYRNWGVRSWPLPQKLQTVNLLRRQALVAAAVTK